jgi:putative transposase
LAYRLTRKPLSALATATHPDIAKNAELPALRHENTVLRRHIPRAHYEPEDRLRPSAPSSLNPRRRLAEVFPASPTTLPIPAPPPVANKQPPLRHTAGIAPAPRRTGPTCHQFLTNQAHGIRTIGFAHVDTV